jgi:hypothetical protein
LYQEIKIIPIFNLNSPLVAAGIENSVFRTGATAFRGVLYGVARRAKAEAAFHKIVEHDFICAAGRRVVWNRPYRSAFVLKKFRKNREKEKGG